jgi:outer membrane protein TolC
VKSLMNVMNVNVTIVLSLTALIIMPPQLALALSRNEKPQQAQPVNEGVLRLEDYLNQVRTGSDLFTSSKQATDAADLRSKESKLLTRPNLIASASYSRSKADTGSTFSGDDNSQRNYSLGLQETTDFGLTAALTYGVVTSTTNASLPAASGFVILPSSTTAGPQLTLTQSLWRNWFGDEIRATQLQIEAAAANQKYAQSFQQTQILAQAEQAYWGLALAREQVSSAQEVLGLTEKSQKWSANRQRLELTDKSDLLQANAALLARRLALQAAVDAEKSASRAFNTARGTASDVVPESLSSFEPTVIDKLQIPQRTDVRDDVKAAEQQKHLAEATARLAEERNTGTLNLTGVIGLNGRDALTGQAISQSTQTNRPNYAIGLNASFPLDFGTQSDVRSGYQKDVVAADTLYKRKVFENDRLWHDLTSLFSDAVGRYKISVEVEKANKEKVTYERFRHDRGRSTLYQVILFENDYAESQLSRIRAQADVLNIYAQLRTYGGGL